MPAFSFIISANSSLETPLPSIQSVKTAEPAGILFIISSASRSRAAFISAAEGFSGNFMGAISSILRLQ